MKAIHDFKHPGQSNAFEVNVESDLALLYSDQVTTAIIQSLNCSGIPLSGPLNSCRGILAGGARAHASSGSFCSHESSRVHIPRMRTAAGVLDLSGHASTATVGHMHHTDYNGIEFTTLTNGL